MPTRSSPGRRRFAQQLALLLCLAALSGTAVKADSFSERRVHIGVKLFRMLVAADLTGASRIDASGVLNIAVIHAGDERDAREILQQLQAAMPSLHGAPVRAETVSVDALMTKGAVRPAAIFIAQALDGPDLARLVRHCIGQQLILFSPFDGDVEKGVLAGLSVEATVRPLINMRTMKASRVSIKDFYLKVAKRHEPVTH
jgi:hypothetical protein